MRVAFPSTDLSGLPREFLRVFLGVLASWRLTPASKPSCPPPESLGTPPRLDFDELSRFVLRERGGVRAVQGLLFLRIMQSAILAVR